MSELKPGGRKATPLRRKRIAKAADDVSCGRKDTERRGVPNDVPAGRRAAGKRTA
jgi:hypothetical protein